MLSMGSDDGPLLPTDSTKSKQSRLPVSELANNQRMNFLRKFYFLGFVQFVAYSVVSSILFLTPGVRGFVQQEHWCRWLVYAGSIAVFVVSAKLESLYPINYLVWLALTAANTLLVAVLSTYSDSEVPLQVCALTASILMFMVVFCSQTSLQFNKQYAIAASFLLTILMSVFVDVTFVLFNFDYILNVCFSSILCAYIHHVADYSMTSFPISQSLRANFNVYFFVPRYAMQQVVQ